MGKRMNFRSAGLVTCCCPDQLAAVLYDGRPFHFISH